MPTRPTYSSAAAPVTQAATQAATHKAGTAATAAATRVAGGSAGPWTAAGGTAVTLAQGETISSLSSRYGVPQDALLKVNGFSSPSQVTAGTRLTIPVYNSTSSQSSPVPAAVAATAAAGTAAATSSATSSVRNLAAKPSNLAAQSEKKVAAVAAKPAELTRAAKAEVAKTEIGKTEVAKTEAARKLAEQKKLAAADQAKIVKAKADEAKSAQGKLAQVKADKTKPEKQVAAAPVAEPETTAAVASNESKPEFRWPARGRIIQGFRNGNEGINIAVPEGTSVKAAEAGVVAYAGSELKGYGNLVLIKHPNGYVSAYAHNGDVSVKRGETVKRGQTIARSGQSGNVSSPQLHFELRKGSTPVDPTGYLAGL